MKLGLCFLGITDPVVKLGDACYCATITDDGVLLRSGALWRQWSNVRVGISSISDLYAG